MSFNQNDPNQYNNEAVTFQVPNVNIKRPKQSKTILVVGIVLLVLGAGLAFVIMNMSGSSSGKSSRNRKQTKNTQKTEETYYFAENSELNTHEEQEEFRYSSQDTTSSDSTDYTTSDLYYETETEVSDSPATESQIVQKNLLGFLFPHSDTELIPEDVIKNLTDEELRYAINEIWARHGYIFENKDLLEYYSQFDWYQKLVSKKEWYKNGIYHYITGDIEKTNHDNLVKERERRGGNGA